MLTKAELKDALGERANARKKAHDVIAAMGDDLDTSKVPGELVDLSKVPEGTARTQAVVDAIKAWNVEAAEQTDEIVEAEEFYGITSKMLADHQAARHPVSGALLHPTPEELMDKPSAHKGLGQLFIESKAYETWKESGQINRPDEVASDLEVKTLFQTSAGWAAETTRTGRVVLDAQRQIEVTDVVPGGVTGQAAIVYMEETTFTSAAAERNEGAAAAESALALTERSSNVRSIGTSIPVTNEQLEDVEGVQSYLENRLGFMVRQRLDGQILTGDGSAPNLTGFLNVSGIQTQAKGGDATPDAVYKAMDLIRVTGRAEPDTAIFHPTDWQDIRLLRTADGVYIWGAPSDAGPQRIWGLPVILTSAETENTALVGAFRAHTQLFERRGLVVEISDSHDDYWTKLKQSIRATMRVALVTYRAEALCTVTGI